MFKLFNKVDQQFFCKFAKFSMGKFSSTLREKKIFERTKDNLNLCMLGSSNHGKTCLLSSITYLLSKVNSTQFKSIENIDNSREEKKKKMSINASKFEYETNKKRCFHTDCPGHKDYLKNTIFGSFGSDVGVLVVAADDVPCSQTRQHLLIAKHAGIDTIIIFVSKADIADDDSREFTELATREMLRELDFEKNKIFCIYGSALKALQDDTSEIGTKSIQKLINTIDNISPIKRDLKSSPSFNVLKVVSPTGRPNGVTGILKCGTLKKGQDVEIIGMDRSLKTRIVSIESFDKIMQEAQAGDSIELLLQGVKHDDLLRGMVISEPGAKIAQDHFEATFSFFKRADGKKQPLITSSFGHIFANTADIHSQILILNKDYLLPEEQARVEIKLLKTVVIEEGESFLLKDSEMIIGMGRVEKFLPKLSNEEKFKLSKGKTKAEKVKHAKILSKLENELN